MISKEELIEALPLANEYTEVRIPKKRGGVRTLFVPSPELKKIQRKILRWLRGIEKIWGWRCSIFGLYHGSYVGHAKNHRESRWIFQFDIKDAFPSVNIIQLKIIIFQKILEALKWQRILKEITGALIEGDELSDPENIIDLAEAETLTNLIIELTTFKGGLPQGAPTSPFLFYIYILGIGLIDRIYLCCRPRRTVSCYIDGFVVSSKKSLSPEIKKKILKSIKESGFKVNPKKIHQFDCRQGAPLICGIRVDGKGRISLPKKKIRQWRGIIHRAAFETDLERKEKLKQKIEGFIASLKPIYGGKLPAQIENPYLVFKTKTNPPN